MIHKARYYAALDLGPAGRPPPYLRYAIWALGAQNSKTYADIHEDIYKCARRYLEETELRDDFFETVTLAQAQTWILLSQYEMMQAHMHRCWMSAGRALRLAQEMKLNSLDGTACTGFRIPQLTVPMDWTDAEEQRRTFWMAYCLDHQLSIGLGWTMSMDEKDVSVSARLFVTSSSMSACLSWCQICTTLPASDDAYQNSTETRTLTLAEAMCDSNADSLSAFAAMIVVTHLCSCRLQALRRLEPLLNGPQSRVWHNGTWLENTLGTDFVLPRHLSLSSPDSTKNLYIVYLNLIAPALTISVHQLAELQALKYNVPLDSLLESQRRRLQLATAITEVLKFATKHAFVAVSSPRLI
jgi:hypothetical protein